MSSNLFHDFKDKYDQGLNCTIHAYTSLKSKYYRAVLISSNMDEPNHLTIGEVKCP